MASVDPEVVPDNPKCDDDYNLLTAISLGPEDVYEDAVHWFTVDSTSYWVRFDNVQFKEGGEPISFDWSSDLYMDIVLVKASNEANVYTYDPPAESLGDTDLGTPEGTPRHGISHVDFCYDYEEEEPAYSFEKYVNGEDADTLAEAVEVSAGDSLTFKYEVTNDGNVSITWTSLTDNVFGDLTTECGLPTTVEVGQSAACEITRTAGDFPEGKENIGTASVTGLDDQTDPAWYKTEPSKITIIKEANVTHDFDFTGDLGDFTLTSKSNDDRKDFTVEPGEYTVEEDKGSFPDKYWALLEVTCTGNSVPVEVDLLNAKATITLQVGEHIICTFHNERVNEE